ncbi:MAG: IS4 family transposase, partial [Candidatus Sulfotelmatobacter sp.]
AVKTQIWIAVSVYVLVAIARKRLGLEANLYQTLQILSVTLFEKTPILCALQPLEGGYRFRRKCQPVDSLLNLFDL